MQARFGGCGFLALLFVWLCVVPPAAAQSLIEDELDQRVVEVTALISDYPHIAGLSEEEKRKLVEFVTGNMLFVFGHESGHALISELGIPVIGREEDGADSFSTVMALQTGDKYADRVLINAATGWFYSDRRSRQDRVRMVFYDEHGIDLQRAYNIVCLMVGSNPEKFSDLADEARIPEERQGTCRGDYSNTEWSWNKVLEPHRRKPAQPKTEVKAVYGPAPKELEIFREFASRMKILETIATMLSDKYIWRVPISLELQTCGEPGARWDITTKKVTACYEIVQEFLQLYRSYRTIKVAAMADPETLEQARTFHVAAE
ncbi:MAG: DUF4344 domain-containing metallopeptidase [Alphaproteobacteria bacterium]